MPSARYKSYGIKRVYGGGSAGGFKKRAKKTPYVQRASGRVPWSQMGSLLNVPSGMTRTGGYSGVEVKFYDTSNDGTAIINPTDAAGGEQDPSATIVLNSVPGGSGESDRNGKAMNMKYIDINGFVEINAQNNQTAVDAFPIVYIALVLDTQTNKETINSEDVFVNKSGLALLSASPFRNLANVKRFRVLKSMTITCPDANITWDGTNLEQQGYHIPFKMHANLYNMEVNFTSAITETIANITDNSLHMIAYTSSTSAVPVLFYNARLRYVG